MPESDAADPEPRPLLPAPRSPLLRDVFWQGSTIFVAATSFAWLLRLLFARDPVRGEWALQVMLAIATLLAGCWGAFERYRTWTVPVRKLLQIVPLVRAGEMPIESLEIFARQRDGPGPLVPVFQDLLRDLRRGRIEVAELEEDVRRRVASRTDALERALGTLKRKASRDPLTGLYNRRMLDEHLPRLVRRRSEDKGALCLLMIDVDHFKLLNDTLGHAAGDELLRSIGQLIRSAVRDTDLAFRYGGDEFVVLLDGCDSPAGQAMADRLASLVEGLGRTLRVPCPPRLSVGVKSLADLPHPTPEGLLQEADRLLYQNKGQRRRHDLQPR